MKEVKKYICDLCGKEHKTKEACLECERDHYSVKEIHDCYYRYGERYPTIIYVRLSNGDVIAYEDKGRVYQGKEG